MAVTTFDLEDLKRRMQGAINALQHDLGGLRTGRASPSLLEPIHVDAYGSMLPLNQVANVSVPEPRLLSVQVWDRGMVSAVEKAIRASDLGLNPQTEGQVIRLRIPETNEQRRKELVKVLHKFAEEGRVGVRHARTEARDRLKKMSGVSEDDVKHAEKDLQKVHDEYIGKIDGLMKGKEAEIMEV
jgi:ribosome recycling factor